MTIGERIRERRKEINLRVPDLARSVGLAASTIYDLERGDSKDTSKLHRFADALDVSLQWLESGKGPKTQTKSGALTSSAANQNEIEIPQLNVTASMGNGVAMLEDVDIVTHIRVNMSKLRQRVTFSAPENLRFVTGLGQSMKGTFSDGDLLLVDVGITDLKIDAVYVMQRNDELFIKRMQRHPMGGYIMKSDNQQFEDFRIEDPIREGFEVLAKVVCALPLIAV